MTSEQMGDQRGTQGGATSSYHQGNNAAFESQMATRTVAHDAAFMLPYLRPGIDLLDAGCGPGSITIGLAAVVAPGNVVGEDFQAVQVEQARVLAAERGVNNVRFETANLHQLPFADGSFDAVFTNAVLMHLQQPLAVLRELRRVLRQSGVIGVRNPDFGTIVIAPMTPLLEQRAALGRRVQQHAGINGFAGRDHRRLLLGAASRGPRGRHQ
jgi:ubiquinone/menaquinone biosynthesis C-methylase UbiE